MIAYKGFSPDLTSRLGDGKKETCIFHPGETKIVEKSKTISCGFHCCENPFECLSYYGLDGRNRFFRVEAAGDIDEDEGERIACTKITLLKELDEFEFALEGMKYMIEHPQRENWQQSRTGVRVEKDCAEAVKGVRIAIARGVEPVARGEAGTILGFIAEESGEIVNAKLIRVTDELAGIRLTLSPERQVILA